MWKYFLLPLVMYGWSDLHKVKSLDEFHAVVNYFRTAFPCEECRKDFDNLMQTHPYPLAEVSDMQEVKVWSWLTHNMVNKKIGKAWEPLSILKNEKSGL